MTTTQLTALLRKEIPTARELLLKATLAGDASQIAFLNGQLEAMYEDCTRVGIDELTLEPVAA